MRRAFFAIRVSFLPQEPIIPGTPIAPAIHGNNVAFFGAGSGGQQGIYVGLPQDPVRIADAATAIPGGTGNFTSFTHPGIPPNPIISGNNVAFFGAGSGGQQGVKTGLITRMNNGRLQLPAELQQFPAHFPDADARSVQFVNLDIASV